MRSTQTLKYRPRFFVAIVCAITLLACGRVQDVAPAPAPTATLPSNGEQTYSISGPTSFAVSYHLNVVGLDFSSSVRILADGERYPGKDYGQIYSEFPEYEKRCDPTLEKEVSALADTIHHPVDTGTVNSVRIDIKTSGGAPGKDWSLCYGVHIRGGGWKWNFALVPIVVDSGIPDEVLSPPGEGHYTMNANTENVDGVAIPSGLPRP
jgi:hypothetical protein